MKYTVIVISAQSSLLEKDFGKIPNGWAQNLNFSYSLPFVCIDHEDSCTVKCHQQPIWDLMSISFGLTNIHVAFQQYGRLRRAYSHICILYLDETFYHVKDA